MLADFPFVLADFAVVLANFAVSGALTPLMLQSATTPSAFQA